MDNNDISVCVSTSDIQTNFVIKSIDGRQQNYLSSINFQKGQPVSFRFSTQQFNDHINNTNLFCLFPVF